MQYEKLGRSGLKVSRLSLGTMNFGGRTDTQTSNRIIATALDAGVNFIDTADVYNEGRSEEIVGAAIRSRRDRVILATKLGNPMGEDENMRGLSRRRVMAAAEASLLRLGLDHIDIYYLHREDHETALEETVRAMGDLMRDGKIRYFGVSNFRAWRIAEVCNLCDRMGIERPVVCQPYYNLVNRMPETEILPACGNYGLGVVPYSPVARGILSGKYKAGSPPPRDSRVAVSDRRMMQTEWRKESLKVAARLEKHAKKKRMSLPVFATAWVLANRFVTSVIAGPRTLEQWNSYLPALDARIDEKDEALVDRLVSPGHPSTPGYNDPGYPLEGRIRRG